MLLERLEDDEFVRLSSLRDCLFIDALMVLKLGVE